MNYRSASRLCPDQAICITESSNSMGLSSDCRYSNIGSVSAEKRSAGTKVSGARPAARPPASQSLSRLAWYEAVVRKRINATRRHGEESKRANAGHGGAQA